MIQILKNFILIFFIYFLTLNPVYSGNITGSNSINSDTAEQQKYNANETSLTITNSATLSRNAAATVHINAKDDGTLIVESGSSVTSEASNAIQGKDQSGLTVTNSGTINADGSKAINLQNAQSSTITNNSGGVIKSNTNTITFTENSGTANNATINNSGEIYSGAASSGATSNNAIRSESDTDNITITNNSGGHIYNNNTSSTALQAATVFISSASTGTLTNSGKIENKGGVDAFAIGIAESGVTVTLKDKGKIIGKINVAGSGHTIKLQHGAGQGYFYNITGSGTYTLQDLDGNPVVKGSAGSVGHGGNEMLDEALGYRSLSVRKSLTRFKQSDEYFEQDQDRVWGELTTSFLTRDGKNSSLKLGSETIGIGANFIEPISKNKSIIMSLENGSLNISQDHDIDKFSFLTGIHFDEIKISENINSELYLLGGIGLNRSDRKILTNTTTSGELNITDSYKNYEFLIGNKIKLNSLFPDISLNFGYSHTPSHEESKYFTWEEKDIYNGSLALSDEYEIIKNKKTSFYLTWIADARSVIDDNEQIFHVNGTKGSYSQHNDLKKELSLSTSLNYEYKFSKNNTFSVALDGLQTSQDTSGIQANLNYKYKF